MLSPGQQVKPPAVVTAKTQGIPRPPRRSAFAIFNDPRNILTILINVISFVAIETVFFWYIASGYLFDLLQEKADVVVDYARQNPEFRASLQESLNSDKNAKDLPVLAEQLKQKRDAMNTDLVTVYVFPVLVVLLVLIFITVARLAVFSRESLRATDILLLTLVLFGFTTELYMYTTVISNLQYIGNNDLLYTIIKGYRKGVERVVAATSQQP
jgi:hypothetical protein